MNFIKTKVEKMDFNVGVKAVQGGYNKTKKPILSEKQRGHNKIYKAMEAKK